MNKERIEISAKAKLESALNQLGYITTEIPSNDKTPSWDGFIRLYGKEDSSSKSELDKMIPVQLKGHFQKPPYARNISFNIETVDLKNYLKNSGVIFFVVYIDDEDHSEIYYESLSPFKIRRLIKGKETQDTISVTLSTFPKDKKEAVDIFFNFTLDMRQSLPVNDITLEDVFKKRIPGFDTFNISYRGIQYKDDPFGYFLSHPTTVNLSNSYTGLSFPLDTISVCSIGSKHNNPISIAGIQYYDNFETIRDSNDNFILHIGKSFTFTLHCTPNEIKGNFNYSIKGNLPERINDMRFLLAYLENKEIKIGPYTGFKLTDEQIKTIDIKSFKSSLRFLEYIDELLKKLKVTTILDYDKITEEDEDTFIRLINTILLGATGIPNETDKLFKLQLANISLLLIANRIDDKNYSIINYFSDENKVQCAYSFKEDNEDKFLVPKTFILSEDDFIILDNIDFEMVCNEIISSQTSNELREYTYYFINAMIEGYLKRTKDKKEFYNYLKKSLSFLKENVTEYDYNSLDKKI